MGTSTVKYTIPLPYISLSGSDSKIHINFEFWEGKNHKDLKKQIDVQSQAIYVDQKTFEKNLHVLEDSASTFIEHIII